MDCNKFGFMMANCNVKLKKQQQQLCVECFYQGSEPQADVDY